MDLEFHPEAADEFEASVAWYAERSGWAAEQFASEVERVVEFIRRQPKTWSHDETGVRRMRLRTFPYSVVYRLRESGILVLAVAHAKRRPAYWRNRILF